MAIQQFALILAKRELSEEDVEKIYAICGDATAATRGGSAYIEFDREAETLCEAIQSALADLKRAGFHVLQIEPSDLVNESEIARRAGVERACIHNYVHSKRGPGSFPRPIAGLTSHSPIWSWAAVAAWLTAHKLATSPLIREAGRLKRINERLRPPLDVALAQAAPGLTLEARGNHYLVKSALQKVLLKVRLEKDEVVLDASVGHAGHEAAERISTHLDHRYRTRVVV